MRRVITQRDAAVLQAKFQEDQWKARAEDAEEIKVSPFTGGPSDTAGPPTGTPPSGTPPSGSAPSGPPPPDDYLTRLQKLIPAEVVAAFLSVDAVVRTAKKTVAAAGGTVKLTNVVDVLPSASPSTNPVAATQGGTTVINMIGPNGYWVIFAVLVLLCAAYARKMATTPTLGTNYRQVIVATLAFVVWTYAIGGPFSYAEVSWWNSALGGIVVTLYTLAAPMFVK